MNIFGNGKKLAAKRYEFDTTGKTVYFVIVNTDNAIASYLWKTGDALPTLDKQWDKSNAGSNCANQNLYVTRNFIAQECLGFKVNVYKRVKGANDGDGWPGSDTMDIPTDARAKVDSDDRLYVTSPTSITTYQLAKAHIFIKAPNPG